MATVAPVELDSMARWVLSEIRALVDQPAVWVFRERSEEPARQERRVAWVVSARPVKTEPRVEMASAVRMGPTGQSELQARLVRMVSPERMERRARQVVPEPGVRMVGMAVTAGRAMPSGKMRF